MAAGSSRGRVALLMIIVLVLCLWLDVLATYLLPALTTLLGVLGFREFHRMAKAQGSHSSLILGSVLSGLFVLSGVLPVHQFSLVFPVMLATACILLFTLQMNRYGIPGALNGVATAGFGLMYVAVPLSLALQVLQLDRLFLFFGLLLIWAADSGAYFVGRAFGKHKLAPNLSPKKTVEGFLGGVATCCLVGALFSLAVPDGGFNYPLAHMAAVGLIIGVLAPIGDLAESVLKRDAGVKDSGTALGGHGGILDRIDSMLFCVPVYYAYLRYLVG